jgi:hypothetical protein
MADLSERHEVRIRGADSVIVFVADTEDGRLLIRQERDGKKSKEVCGITLANPEELRAFFKGLRRIAVSLGEGIDEPASVPRAPPAAAALPGRGEADREAAIAQARERNPQAFASWTPKEEDEVRRRYEKGEPVESIARAQKRSARAIELRLQRMGARPPR